MGRQTKPQPFWRTKRIGEMSEAEWESLCDGCGRCCLHKIREDDGSLSFTNVACRLLDRHSGRCSDYRNRRAFVPDCVQLRPELVGQLDWLPGTCAYRRVDEGRPLPAWHYLVSGDREAVHEVGASVRGWTISEVDASVDLENHIIDGD